MNKKHSFAANDEISPAVANFHLLIGMEYFIRMILDV